MNINRNIIKIQNKLNLQIKKYYLYYLIINLSVLLFGIL